MARPARGAPGRRRRDPRAARDRAADAGETGIEFTLLEANAEEVPLPDASFDVVVSEYGASIWCDPYKWIPEAARLLRPGGELVFLRNATLAVLCANLEGDVRDAPAPAARPAPARLGGRRHDVEFQLGHGELFRLLRETGFDVST